MGSHLFDFIPELGGQLVIFILNGLDIDLLMIYARKLSILEKWERVRAANAGKLLEEALAV